MEIFLWDKNLVTGLQEVDDQHKHLVEIINKIALSISENDIDKNFFIEIYKELVKYTKYHFREEESLMRSVGIDQRHLQKHIKAHSVFIQSVSEMQCDFVNGDLESCKDAFSFLINWLVYHILGEDISMSRQIFSIQKGVSPSEAFAMEESKAERSTSMLLTSLTNLIDQLSKKNNKLKELNTNLESIVKKRTAELQQANKELHILATTDSLTNLANRRRAIETLQILWKKSNTHGEDLSCIMIDADNFKQVNDEYGHDAGDLVLQKLSKTILHAIRTDDVVCRLGGDEFLVICPHTANKGAFHLANIIHEKVNKMQVTQDNCLWQGSISVGVATKSDKTIDIHDLLKQADIAVYNSKKAGRNCIKGPEN